MTDDEILALEPNDEIRVFHTNLPARNYRITQVKARGRCVSPVTGAFGHAYALIECPFGPRSSISFSITSDEYHEGSGYPVHDENGRRIRGVERVGEAPTGRAPCAA